MANGASNPFGQGSWPDNKGNVNPPIGTGEGESPMTSPGTPKISDMDVRTYGSDTKSMSESGGGAPRPYQPVAQAPTPPPPAPPTLPAEKKSFSEVFEAPGGISPASLEVPPASLQEFKTPKSKKGLFIGILVLILVVGLGAIGYFYVYPTFFGGGAPEAPASQTPQAPEAQTPQVPVVPEVPVVNTGASTTATTTFEVPPAGETGAVIEHQSLFKTAADLKATTTPPAGKILTFSTAQVPVLKEIIIYNNDGTLTSFTDMASDLFPDVFTSSVTSMFNPDFTLFAYTDSKGTWFGFAARLKSGSSLTDAQTAVSKLEGSKNLTSIFLAAPGTPTAWKSGSVSGVATRYLTYSQAGASLNYGWLNDTLVVSASYSSFQEAMKRLK